MPHIPPYVLHVHTLSDNVMEGAMSALGN